MPPRTTSTKPAGRTASSSSAVYNTSSPLAKRQRASNVTSSSLPSSSSKQTSTSTGKRTRRRRKPRTEGMFNFHPLSFFHFTSFHMITILFKDIINPSLLPFSSPLSSISGRKSGEEMG
ncbi:hypothetical protein TWF569_004441, partial [Orbilia oligospora]